MKIRIEFDKGTCIGNKACLAMDFKRWKDVGDKVNLIGGKEITKNIFYLEGNYSKEEIDTITEGAKVCPVNAIAVKNLETGEYIYGTEIITDHAEEVGAEYDDSKEFQLDKEGYFLIRVDEKNKNIEVGFCREPNKVSLKVTGKKPIDIYHMIINKKKLNIRKDHCAYLGRELQKAYIALKKGIKYVQDDELKF